MEMITISKKEYERLKALDEKDELVEQFKESLKDLEEGRFTEC